MASIRPIPAAHGQQLTHEKDHPCWMKAFNDVLRTQQLTDDDQAWKAVTGTLITIVTIGVILAAVTVSICLMH